MLDRLASMKICTQCGTRFSEPVAFCPHDGTPTSDFHDAPPPDPLLGRVIDGRYRVERQIGEGGMGLVYQISHAVLGKRMALKVLRDDSARDADVVQRFMQEAQSATSIGHANIIDISDFGRLPDGSVYFVMEYLDGESLTRMISRGGSIPMVTAVHVIRQIASALEAAHARGIVHRDLKPDNIYLVKRGTDSTFVKVLDFGIAKVGGSSSKLTKTGMIFGTPHYMSPEQASGQSVDRRTDIYALGVIMYEMFTGKVPFDGDTFMGILSKHMFEQPLPPSQVQGKRLGAIEDVIMRSLAKKPEDRYPSMGDLIRDLDRVAAGGAVEIGRGHGGIAAPSNLADALEPPSRTEMRLGVSAIDPEQEPAPTLPRSRGPLIALAVAALACVGLGVGGVVFWATGSPATASGGDPARTAVVPAVPTLPISPVVVPSVAPGGPGQPVVPAAATGSAPAAPGTTTPTVASTGGQPARVPSARLIEISSDPSGAEVILDGAIVGNTPVRLPAPEAGERVARVQLRGYQPSSVMLAAGSPETVRIELEPVQVATAPAARPAHAPRAPHATTTPARTQPTTPTPPSRRTSSTSEVVDPWN
jgi:tRNA A-37 threonylcarbamoyl transferase component Bud32